MGGKIVHQNNGVPILLRLAKGVIQTASKSPTKNLQKEKNTSLAKTHNPFNLATYRQFVFLSVRKTKRYAQNNIHAQMHCPSSPRSSRCC
jgi:hypothetical protein